MAGLSTAETTMSGQGFTAVNDIPALMVKEGMATPDQVSRMTGPQSFAITGGESLTQGRETQAELVKMGIATQEQVGRHQQTGLNTDAAKSTRVADHHKDNLAADKSAAGHSANQAAIEASPDVRSAIGDLRKGISGDATHTQRQDARGPSKGPGIS